MHCVLQHLVCPLVFDSGSKREPLIPPLVINIVKKAFSIHSHQQIFISHVLDCSQSFCDISRAQVTYEETGVPKKKPQNPKPFSVYLNTSLRPHYLISMQ